MPPKKNQPAKDDDFFNSVDFQVLNTIPIQIDPDIIERIAQKLDMKSDRVNMILSIFLDAIRFHLMNESGIRLKTFGFLKPIININKKSGNRNYSKVRFIATRSFRLALNGIFKRKD